MKAIVVQKDKAGHPLIWQTVPAPTYNAHEVLVNIQATALNRADLMQRAGHYPPPPGASPILGLEMAGTISAIGTDVTDWKVGDRVCALLAGGGYATQVNVPAQLLMPVPKRWTFEQAAAMSEVFYTAYVNLFMEAGLQKGETVLIHGGASGVGTAAIQLVHEAGCQVIVTASTDEKIAQCLTLGANRAINYKTEDFVSQVLDATDGVGVDVILDMVGAAYLKRNIQLLKPKGRLVLIAMLGGIITEINLRPLLLRRLRIIGSVLRSRTLSEKVEIKQRFWAQFGAALEAGTIQPIIDSVYSIEEVEVAHQRMATNQNIGKIVLRVGENG